MSERKKAIERFLLTQSRLMSVKQDMKAAVIGLERYYGPLAPTTELVKGLETAMSQARWIAEIAKEREWNRERCPKCDENGHWVNRRSPRGEFREDVPLERCSESEVG